MIMMLCSPLRSPSQMRAPHIGVPLRSLVQQTRCTQRPGQDCFYDDYVPRLLKRPQCTLDQFLKNVF